MKLDANHPHYALAAAKKLNPSLVVWYWSESWQEWVVAKHPNKLAPENSYALTTSE